MLLIGAMPDPRILCLGHAPDLALELSYKDVKHCSLYGMDLKPGLNWIMCER
jgi:hypothetical protein